MHAQVANQAYSQRSLRTTRQPRTWNNRSTFNSRRTVIDLTFNCQLQYYYPPAEPMNTLILTCPRMEMMRLWPVAVEQPWFEENKVCYTTTIFYHTQTNKAVVLPDLNLCDEIVFTSPSTVDAFIDLCGSLPEDIQLTPIGPITKNKLKECKVNLERSDLTPYSNGL